MNTNALKPVCTEEQKLTRSLYECSHAQVKGDRIRCRRDHPLLVRTEDGGIDVSRLAKGQPLIYGVCQDCPDFDSMGPPLPPEERGWLKGNGNA